MLAPSTDATPGGLAPASTRRRDGRRRGAACQHQRGAEGDAGGTVAHRKGTPHPEILNNPLAAAKDLSKGRLRNHEGAAVRSPQIAAFEESCWACLGSARAHRRGRDSPCLPATPRTRRASVGAHVGCACHSAEVRSIARRIDRELSRRGIRCGRGRLSRRARLCAPRGGAGVRSEPPHRLLEFPAVRRQVQSAARRPSSARRGRPDQGGRDK